MSEFKNQLRQVLRRLGRAPMFTVITLITLAAGVGANTVVFSVLEGVLLKPLPYPHSEELVGVWHTAPGLNIPELNMSPSNYFIYREQGRTFQDIGMYQGDSVSVTGVGEPEQVASLNVTEATLSLLGVQPIVGRLFRHEDDVAGAPQTVVLSYGYWRRKFAGAASAVGQTLVVDGKGRQIIGVLPREFHFLDQVDPALLMPFQFDRNKTHLGNFSYEALARLKPGMTLAQANADVARMLPIVMSSFPVPPGFSLKLFEDAHVGPNVRPLKQDVVGDVGSVLWVLMGSIGMVLLIACANVANLLLVRTEGRRQELALRAALGASWGRVAGELLLESLILGLLGSVVGLALAYGALRVLVVMAPAGLPRISEVGLNGPVLLFTLLIALAASLLFGSVPILKYAGARLTTGIREGGRGLSQSKEQHRARNTLVVVQVALALVLLICSGLMIRTFRALTKVNPGFSDPAELQTFRISIPETHVKEGDRVIHMEEEILHKLEAIPGVSSVSIGTKLPMNGDGWHDPILLQGRTYAEGEFPPLRLFKFVSPGFLRTLVTRTPRAGSETFLKDAREAVWSVDANLPLADVHTIDYFYRRSMARTSFTLIMLGVAGSMALLLGVVGIYGVIAYSVSQRTREIGIRMALGAQQPTVTGMFVRHGLVLTGVGVACGLIAAVLLMRLMSSLLFNVNPVDPVTYGAVSIGLVGTAWLASYLPSRRAATVDPVEALRAE